MLRTTESECCIVRNMVKLIYQGPHMMKCGTKFTTVD